MSNTRREVANGPGVKPSTSWWRACLGIVVSLSLAVVNPRSAEAINIVIEYSQEDNSPFEVDNENGTTLVGIFNAAASIWEECLWGDFTLTVDVSWDDDLGEGTLGVADSISFDIDLLADPVSSGTLDHPAEWYVDQTPLNHSEFNFSGSGTEANEYMGQTLYQDLPPQVQDAWFDGNVPNLLEVGYRGNAAGWIDPDTGQPSLAEGKYDMLDVALHELGHVLGVNYDPEAANWEPPAAWLGGASTEIKPHPSDSGHLAAESSLMRKAGGGRSRRGLPSAMDVLAVAADEEGTITAVDLRRQDFLKGTAWESGSNWEGGQRPNSDNHAFVRNGGTVTMGNDRTILSLLIANGSEVRMLDKNLSINQEATPTPLDRGLLDLNDGILTSEGGKLTVTGGTTVAEDSLLDMQSNAGIELDDLELINGSWLKMGGGAAWIHGQLTLSSDIVLDSILAGHGTVAVHDQLVNDGEIRAQDGTLNLTNLASPTPAVLDLDGVTESGVLTVTDGDLFCSVSLTDAFDGQLTIREGRTATFYNGWTLGYSGNVILNDLFFSDTPGTLNSLETLVHGRIDAHGLGVIESPVWFYPTTKVEVPHVQSRLRLAGVTYYEGGSYTGNGALEQWGNAEVNTDTTIATVTYDWDGSEAAPSIVKIKPEVTLRIDSMRIEEQEDDGYDGATYVYGGILEVNTTKAVTVNDQVTYIEDPWRLDEGGILELQNATLYSEEVIKRRAEVRGSPIDVAGKIIARRSGNGIQPDMTFRITADVQVPNEDDELYLGYERYLDKDGLEQYGEVEYQGGSYTGKGSIYQYKDARFVDDTFIQVDTYDWDGYESYQDGETTRRCSTTISSGATVWLRSRQIDSDGDGYDGIARIHAGTLIVSTWEPTPPQPPNPGLKLPVPWRLDPDGMLDLYNYAVISGSSNPNDPYYSGGSTMLVSGHIQASGPGNRIYAPVVFEPTADVVLAADAYLYLHSDTVYQGGSFKGLGTFTQTGDAVIQQPIGFQVARLDMDGGTESTTWTLESDLLITADRLDLYDSNFDGTIEVVDDSRMTVDLQLNAADGWQMAGLIDVHGLAGTTFRVGGAPVKLNGNVNVNSGNTLVFDTHVSGVPTVSGGGLVVYNAGLSPGNSTATIEFSGSVEFGPNGTLSLEIADRDRADRTVAYDQLSVRRNLTLDGALDLIFVDQFAPQIGDTFDLLNLSGTTQGQFSEVNVVNLRPGFQYTTGWERNVFRLRALSDGVFFLEHPLVPGDFNGNQVLDVEDIDKLTAAIRAGTHDTFFDLDEDERVNSNDLSIWVASLKTTWFGDANLDLEFNSSDLVHVLGAGKYETEKEAGWSEGDWNGDGYFRSSDLVTALQDGGYELGPRVAVQAVPEPGAGLLVMLGVTLLFYQRSRRQRNRSAVRNRIRPERL